jgi:membrane-bound metal-dependent hydrolase YbcI (DUF457 family)
MTKTKLVIRLVLFGLTVVGTVIGVLLTIMWACILAFGHRNIADSLFFAIVSCSVAWLCALRALDLWEQYQHERTQFERENEYKRGYQR